MNKKTAGKGWPFGEQNRAALALGAGGLLFGSWASDSLFWIGLAILAGLVAGTVIDHRRELAG